MKTYLPVLFICLICSCADTQNPDALSPDENLQETSIGDTCRCEDLVVDSTGIHTLNNKNFTGTCLSYYEGTTNKYIEKNILDGKLHGKVEYYDKAGELLLQEYYEYGEQKRTGGNGSGITCDCGELESQLVQGMSVYKLDNVPFTGKCEKYYPDSKQIYMESNYKNGLLEGYTIFYNRDGSTILMEKYERGEVVSAIH